MGERHAARAALRAATSEDHARLDGLFETFDLSDPNQYRIFLTAHARALPAVEAALDASGFAAAMPDWNSRQRTAALAADLAALGVDMPDALPAPVLDSEAAQWGAAYVLEGSRLGGAMLSKRVPEGAPRSYLGTPQAPGAWRALLDMLDNRLVEVQDLARATESARQVFALFEQAGRVERETLPR